MENKQCKIQEKKTLGSKIGTNSRSGGNLFFKAKSLKLPSMQLLILIISLINLIISLLMKTFKHSQSGEP